MLKIFFGAFKSPLAVKSASKSKVFGDFSLLHIEVCDHGLGHNPNEETSFIFHIEMINSCMAEEWKSLS